MTNTPLGLINFSSKDPQEIVFELFRIRQRILLGENLEMPLATLLLWPEGTQVNGFILDIKLEKGDHHIAIQLASSSNIFYVYMGVIRGVVVHDIEKFESIFTSVSSSTKMNSVPTTTKLEIRKRLDEESKKISERIGTSIPYKFEGELISDPTTLFVIANIIIDVTMSLLDLMQTEVGHQAVKEAISKVTFVINSEAFSVIIKEKELIVTGNFADSFTTTQGRWKLKDIIEGIL